MPWNRAPSRAAGALVLAAFLGIAAAWAFHGTLDAFFTQDDFWLLAAAEQPQPNRAMFGGALLPHFVRPLSTYWWPLVNTAVFGLDARGHHLALLALFALTVATFVFVPWRRHGSLLAASCGVTLYAFSEVHLFTLGWLAGAIDVLFAAAAIVVLLALARPERPNVRLALVAFFVAVFAKEVAIVLALAWFGALLAERITASPRPRIEAADRRLALGFAVVIGLYVAAWVALASDDPDAVPPLVFEVRRGLTVLAHSILVVHPTIDQRCPVPAPWLLVPPALTASTIALGGRPAAREAIQGFLLWILPATAFVVVARPAGLQEYYAHLSTLGLVCITAQAVATVLRRWPRAVPLRLALLAAAAAVAVVAFGRRLDDVANSRSPSLHQAAVTAAAARDLAAALAEHPATRIEFVGTSSNLWWALGKGAMVPLLHPGTSAVFDGHDGVVPAGARTQGDTLVLRQVGDRGFEIVR